MPLVQGECQGQTTCVMKVSDADLNLSPECGKNVCKYLEVNYTCESRSMFCLNCPNLLWTISVTLCFGDVNGCLMGLHLSLYIIYILYIYIYIYIYIYYIYIQGVLYQNFDNFA